MHSQESLDIVRRVTVTVPSFHHYYHVLYDLSKLINKQHVSYVEVGAYAGASAILLLHNPKVAVISIDLGTPIPMKAVLKNVASFFDDNRYKYIKGNSHLQETKDKLFEKEIDILFIDGDHSYRGVKRDFELYAPLVSRNGFIVFDDYWCPACPGVRPAVDEIVSKAKGYEVIGTLKNTFLTDLNYSNCFIIRKR